MLTLEGANPNPTNAFLHDVVKHFNGSAATLIYSGRNIRLKYIIFQRERAPSTGTPHFQGYFEFTGIVSGVAIGEFAETLLGNAFFVPAKGTRDQCVAYCSKEAPADAPPLGDGLPKGPWKWEASGGQGARNDLAAILKKVDEGVPQLQLFQEHPSQMLKMYKGVNYYSNLLAASKAAKRRKADEPFDVIVCTGGAGLGKSVWQRNDAENEHCSIFESVLTGGWWDGYDGQSAVIISEFRGQLQTSVLKQLLDKDAQKSVNIKGGVLPFLAHRVYINSNYEVKDWYHREEAKEGGNSTWLTHDFPAISRRITKYLKFVMTDQNTADWKADTNGDWDRKFEYATRILMKWNHELNDWEEGGFDD